MSSPRLRSGPATSSPIAVTVLVVSQLALSSGCQKPTVQADPAAPPSSTPATTSAAAASSSPASTPSPSASAQPKPGSPLSRLAPVPRPVRSFCPLTIEPGVALGPIALGETLLELGRRDDANYAFKRVLRFDPEHIGALYYEGAILVEQERYPQAIERFQKVVDMAPATEYARKARRDIKSATDLGRRFAKQAG